MLDQMDRLVSQFEEGLITRRALLARLGALMAAAGVGGQALASAKKPSTFSAVSLDHIALNVTDIGRSRDFYIKHLGLNVKSDGERSCFLGCGDDFVALFKSDKASMDHYCYAIKEFEAADAVKRLEAAGLTPRRRGNRVYFEDPDGLEVQVAAK